MAANQVDFKILPSDQFSVYSPQTRSDKVITYFTLLSKLRGDILSVGQEDDPNNIVSAFYINTGNVQTLHLVKADGSEVTASNSFAGTVTSVDMSVPTGFSISGNPITTSGTLAVGFASGYSLPTDAIQATWTTAYNRSLTSAAVTGTSTKTLTLNQQDGGTITASWSDIDTGLTSVGLTMPAAFSVANSPLTANGTLAVTAAGLSSQYIRGDGQLANFPTPGGGGSSVNYYLNGSVSQGTFGGVTYYELSKTPIAGAGTNFTRAHGSGDGYIASFITDANDPDQINIPGGNWNLEFYFNSSSSGGSPAFYGELYKVSVSNVFTLIASGSVNPESITGGTTVDQYYTSIAVPQTALLATDRLAIRVYVIVSGKNITLHTENSNFSEVITTFSTGLNSLNGLSDQVQYFAVGTSGTDFAISSSLDTHTFNLPTASAANRGALSSADWTTFNSKQGTITLTTTGSTGAATFISNTLNIPSYTDQFVGTVTSVNLTAGTGITVSGGPITTSGSITVNNSDRGSSQNIFKNFAVAGQSTIVADTNDDTLTIVAGSGVTLTTNDTTDTLTISASGSGGTVTSVGTSAPLTGGPITATGTIGITQSGVSTDGYLSSIDWNTFNSKQSTLVFSGPLVNTSGTVSIPVATTSVSGYLNNTDWTTFNSKQNAITLTTTGTTGAATLIGATLNIPNYADQFVGTVTSVNMSVPTGFAISGNPITTSGTLAVAFDTGYSLPTNASQTTWNTAYNDSITAFAYNTSTAVLTLTQQDAGTLTATVTLQPFTTTNLAEGTNLYYTDARARLALSAGTGISYDNATGIITNSAPDQTVVLTGGTGITTSGTYPSFTVTNSDRGSSQNIFKNIAVAGQSTIVADVNDDTLTVVAGSGVTITTNDTTDTITISATGSGGSVTSVGTTAPITGGTITTTGTIGITQSGAAADGYLSSTDWNTFNNKQNALTNPVTGTGTTNYVSKFTSSSAIGNSQIFDDGTNVGIGTASPLAKLHVAGTVATDSALADVSAYRIIKPNSGFRVTANSSETGAIKITYPVGFTNTMHRIKLNVYEYVTNESFTIYFGGYNYAPGSSWYNPFAYILGNPSKDQNYTVRFGYNGTSMVVYIGELATGWTYPQIFIEEVELGYSGMSNTWRDGAWTISFEASAFQNVTETVSNTQATNLARSGSNAYYGFGNVGIGTTAPQAPLHVIAASNANDALIQEWSYTSGNIDVYSLMLKQTVTSGVVRYNFSMVNNSTAYNDVLVLDRGNVGIGTTSPTQKLDVATGDIALGYNQTTTNRLYKNFATAHAAGNVPSQLSMVLDDGSDGAVRIKNTRTGSYNSQAIHFDVHEGGVAARADAMIINYTGNVGIGTTGPGFKLTVAAASATDSDILLAGMTGVSNGFTVRRVSSSFVYSMIDGGLGINNAAPTQALHVTGNARVTGAFIDSGNSAGTSGQILSSTATGTSWIAASSGSVTSVDLTAGTGISVSGGPITTSGSITVTNTAPDQTVALTGAGTTTISGTYPSFTITSNDQYVGTVTSVGLTGGTGISISGGPITGSGSITVTNSAPDQTVALTAGTGISISGTYPSFTITNTSAGGGTITGSGTTNYVPKWTSASAIGDSAITDDGTTVALVSRALSGTSATFSSSVTAGGELNIGTGALSSDRMMQVSGTSFTSGTSQFAAVFNPTFGNTISNLYGIYISLASGTSVTNRYQLYVDGAGAGTATNDYAIYSANTAKSYFAGKVGINTTAPLAILSVGSGSLGDDNLPIQISTAGGITERYIAINKNGAYGLIVGYNENAAGLSGVGAYIRQVTADPLYFLVNNTTTAMTILSGGNVGINTTAPGYKLDVNGGSAFRDTIRVVATPTDVAYLSWTGTNTGALSLLHAGSVTAQILASGNSYLNGGNVGIGTTAPNAKLDVAGGINTRNTRVNSAEKYPVGHYSFGETVFEIDPTWTEAQLQDFFNSGGVSWTADSTAPGGYAIQIDGSANVGAGEYDSGFPYIPVDSSQDDWYYMECYIRNDAGSSIQHYMGGIDFNQNFSSLGGNPGSYTYNVMFNYNPGTSWTKVYGYWNGFGSSYGSAGTGNTNNWVSGTKYFTPQALFNYGLSSGIRRCYISGWKCVRVRATGNRYYSNNVLVSGNVGIGITVPGAKLEVAGASNGTAKIGDPGFGSNYTAISLNGTLSTSDYNILSAVGDKDLYINRPTGWAIRFRKANVDQVVILDNGNVGIGTGPSYRLDVSGDARILSGSLGVGVAPNATDGRIDASNDIVAFSSSDLRLKENIKPIENALEKVKSLTGVEFDWKPELKHAHGYEGHDTGVIAQEVQEVMPTAIRTNDTGYLAVRYEKLIGLLIEANKELAARVEELESKFK